MTHPVAGAQRVLVVDDHELSRRFTLAALRESVPSVKQARSGREAIRAAKRFQPDLVIIDLNLPDMDGLEAIATIRAEWTASAPPPEFVVLSAETGERSRRRLARAGIGRVLAKPVAASEITQLVSRAAPPYDRNAAAPALTAVRRLAERELEQGLRELDGLISGADWPLARELSHRLIASAALAGHQRLERSLRMLQAACTPESGIDELATAYFAVLDDREAFEDSRDRRAS